jgi:hypothetical protein
MQSLARLEIGQIFNAIYPNAPIPFSGFPSILILY